jgi:nucleolar protein 15
LTTTEDLVSTQDKKVKTPKSVITAATDPTPAKKVDASDRLAEKKDKKAAKVSAKSVKETSNGVSAVTHKTDKSSSKKENASKKKVEAKTEAKQTEDKDEEVDEDSGDEIDDQTEALLKGFESDRDEEDGGVEEEYKDGDEIPPITKNEKLSKKKQAKLKRAAAFPQEGKPGVVYVGRIPHGFYENEMRAYFGQFGTILQLRLSRNPRTGRSRHYAFIQFENSGVADIVAKTMDNYLMFGHLLKVKFIPEERVPADVWKGANKRFKKVPWNKMKGRELEQSKSEKVWEERIEREKERRDKKAEKLKAIGYEFNSPEIKSAKGVSKKEKPVLELADKEGETEAIEAAPAAKNKMKAINAALITEESSKPKKKKKSKAGKKSEGAAAVEEPSKSETEETFVDVKPSKKDVEESVVALIAEVTEKPSKKEKKDKKKKAKVIAE